mmetsp:Transcript_43718/g.98633  ORF Transcript_43718/g.98633 Transcript_43718/m.98633 type:complete len:254 (+) Transcript_43718:523-1284(+)
MAGTALAESTEVIMDMNLRAKKVKPSWLEGLRMTSRGFASLKAFSTVSRGSSPVKRSACPPICSSRAASTAAASWSSVAPSGTPAAGRHSTPTGTCRRTSRFLSTGALTSPSTTTASMLFQSFCTSPSSLRRSPSLSQRPASSKPASSSGLRTVRTEPSALSGTSSGKSHFLREKIPSRRPLFSSKAGTPLPTARSATCRRATQGFASYSGSSVRETRIVSPMPSRSRAPMPTADLIRPSAPPPASVTPRCRG